SPPGGGVYLSVLLRPGEVPMAALGSLAAVAGLALTDTAAAVGVDAVLKWPNDVLAGPDGAKCAGVLAEAVSSDEQAVVLGIGVNVAPLRTPVRPGPGGLPATSPAE
ncbi:biotin--[acetyl-CoA-carboxylase] ligase, partial [Saccharomonospora iraqiensis]|uniref:biotin--[acetyl-CoA-carboxylase] ligase n=1 Tax=Saccharomonospora iraqiensis TaxID=52698 RepID=UPI000593C868